MTFALAVDALVVLWLLYRVRRVRRVRSRLGMRLPAILGVVGLLELLDYTGTHRVAPEVAGVLAFSFLVGAIAFGALRAATVRIWRDGGLVLRQGTWLTVGLWLAGIGVHYGSESWIDALHGPGGVISASLLLWLGISYGVQNAVVHRRAASLLAHPDVGDVIDARSEARGGVGDLWVRPGRGGGPGSQGTWAGGRGLRRPRSGARGGPEAIDVRSEPSDPGTGKEGPGRHRRGGVGGQDR